MGLRSGASGLRTLPDQGWAVCESGGARARLDDRRQAEIAESSTGIQFKAARSGGRDSVGPPVSSKWRA